MTLNAPRATPVSLPSPDDLASLQPSWVRSLKAANLAPRTIVAYTGSLESLQKSLLANGRPTDITLLRREHLENWLVEMLEAGASASTAAPEIDMPNLRALASAGLPEKIRAVAWKLLLGTR